MRQALFLTRAVAQWQWEVNLLKSPQIRAFCMPSGKIAVLSGLVETLKPTDDEFFRFFRFWQWSVYRHRAMGKQEGNAIN